MQEKSLIKKNILQYLKLKDITMYEFYKKTGITRGVLSQNNGMSEENTTKILAYFQEINPEWLLTGKGSMLKSEDCNKIQEDEISNNVDYKEKYINIIEENRELRIDIINKEKQIQELKETTEKLKEKIDLFQKEVIKSKELKNRSKVPPVKLPNSPECVQ